MGRVSKHKKIKRFDVHQTKLDNTVNKPAHRNDSNKLPRSLRVMKFHKQQVEAAEARRKERIQQKKMLEKKANKPAPKPVENETTGAEQPQNDEKDKKIAIKKAESPKPENLKTQEKPNTPNGKTKEAKKQPKKLPNENNYYGENDEERVKRVKVIISLSLPFLWISKIYLKSDHPAPLHLTV